MSEIISCAGSGTICSHHFVDVINDIRALESEGELDEMIIDYRNIVRTLLVLGAREVISRLEQAAENGDGLLCVIGEPHYLTLSKAAGVDVSVTQAFKARYNALLVKARKNQAEIATKCLKKSSEQGRASTDLVNSARYYIGRIDNSAENNAVIASLTKEVDDIELMMAEREG